ncbi:MAG: hypothetical protein RMJ17_03585 [Candidatus Aenigmarchaeota archaeon]|nr:hypothetical protein [Candidatus Aenigmarchaeota archaeon]MDW8149645.1 hypothetical protein [Candidatus Aenigmarchaeota archaeon]
MRRRNLSQILIFMLSAIFLAGCIEQRSSTFLPPVCLEPEGITLENYRVSNLDVRAGETTHISFTLTNNCRIPSTIKNMKIVDLSAFDEYVITCDNIKEINKPLTVTLQPFQSKPCTISLRAPTEITTNIPVTIIFAYSFDLINTKSVLLPVIDDITVKRPHSKYQESLEKFGYVDFEVLPPVGNIKVEKDRVVKEYWGVVNQPFKLEFYLIPRVRQERVEYTIKEVKVEPKESKETLDYNCGDEKTILEIIKKVNKMQLKEKVPFRCEFIYKRNVPEVYVRVDLNVSYEVTIYKHQTFAFIV